MTNILIVEDQTLLLDSLKTFLNAQDDICVVGTCPDADDAYVLCKKLSPTLLLVDVVTNGQTSGITLTADIRRKMPDIKVVVMTAYPEVGFINAARNAGAHSFVYKDADLEHLLYVIRRTVKGEGIYPGPTDSGINGYFTDKEIAVIRLVCQGKSRNEIASILFMSEGSVKGYISDILDKTGFDSIMKFAIYAVANGFIVPQGDTQKIVESRQK